MLSIKEFLQKVVTCEEKGHFYLAVSNGSGWLEQWHNWPDDIDEIARRAEAQAQTANVYFSSYIFKARQATKDNILPTRTIQADLDEADLTTLPREPNVLVESSPGRHQGYWILDREVPLEQHEDLSRKLTYAIPLCDRSGWPLGRKLRIPGTLNHKYLDGPKQVTITKVHNKLFSPEEFEALPEVPHFIQEHFDETFLENPTEVDEHPLEILERIREKIPSTVYVTYDIKQADRSAALYAFMCYAFKAGLNRNEVFTVAKASANNKWSELRYRSDQALAKDVLRAELAVNSRSTDTKQVINDLFKSQLSHLDRKRQILNVIIESMKAQGVFIHANNGYCWYIRRDLGKPVQLTAHSEALFIMLDIQYGLNYTDPEAKYVAHGLRSYANNLPPSGVQSALSYYDPDAGHILLHTGRRTVLKVTSSGVERAINGAFDVVFPWHQSTEEFVPTDPHGIDWGDELFKNGERGFGTSVENLTNLQPNEALALLKVWFLFVLLRNAASSRPIIATFGQPGSGKSTLFKKVYIILFGRRKSLGAVTNMDDFDHNVAADPLVVLDNVDTWEKWLPDRIALSAGTSDLIRRKLYTDSESVTLKRQAMVGVTAHNPQFGREDVADRFLLFAFRRFTKFFSEEPIYHDLYARRNRIWGAIIADIQRVLATPLPILGEAPQFRIEDFARIGLWISRALGCEQDFRDSIKDVKSAQQSFSLEEEGMLVNAVRKFADTQTKRADGPQYYSASDLWSMVLMCADDERGFTNRYRNAVNLSKKLSSMQDSLKKIISIEFDSDDAGVRRWKIANKQKEQPQ
jgi:hypothetical protein